MIRNLSISVVVCSQNVVDTIDECLASLISHLNQSYIHEIIVVDGQSTDGTRKILEKFPVKIIDDSYRYPYVYSIPKNLGWRNAGGELVMFIDADAYIANGLIPDVTQLFLNEKVGIVGVVARAVESNSLSRAIGQWWDWHYRNSVKSVHDGSFSWFHHIHTRASSYCEILLPAGPCYLVRRECLEEIGGFDESNRRSAEDIRLSKAIIEKGWESRWWLKSSVFHYPPSHFTELIKQRYRWGKGDCCFNFESHRGFGSYILPPLIRLGTPFLGFRMALHYKNPLQVVFFPAAQYAWIAGYFTGLIKNST